MPPKMIVIAGPPGSGKSAIFPVSGFGTSFFNADDKAAERNGGSFAGISRQIRNAVNQEFETFIRSSIDKRNSFAIETTLRSTVTFEQARMARAAGFVVEMRYISLRDFRMHLERVKARADAGGHSASEPTLRSIYTSSLSNLPQAIAEMDYLWAYDNSPVGGPPSLVLEAERGEIRFVADPTPQWIKAAMESLR